MSCRYNLYLNITPAGTLMLTWPDKEPDEIEHSCALDLADGGAVTLHTVGRMLNLTRERARQLEERALAKMHDVVRAQDIDEGDIRSSGYGEEHEWPSVR